MNLGSVICVSVGHVQTVGKVPRLDFKFHRLPVVAPGLVLIPRTVVGVGVVNPVSGIETPLVSGHNPEFVRSIGLL